MSTSLYDVADQANLGQAAAPQTATSTVTGSAVDMIASDGKCFAVQSVGTVSGTTPSLAGKFQESADGSSGWGDVTGATFTAVTASTNLQTISFDRTKRYLRYIGTITGTSPSFALAAVVGQQKKQL
jgi:hypothetical protein